MATEVTTAIPQKGANLATGEEETTTPSLALPAPVESSQEAVLAAAPADGTSTVEKGPALENKIDTIVAQTLTKMEEEKGKEIAKPMEPFASTIPQIRVCHSWDQFKNHHSADEHRHAIETLTGGESLKTEIEEASTYGYGDEPFFRRGYMGHGGGYFGRGRSGWKSTVVDDGAEAWLHQVRINSKFIMTTLGRQSSAGKTWKGQPHIFVRPFRYLIHFHAEMKKELTELERASAISPPDGVHETVGPRSSVKSDSFGLEKLFTAEDAEAELAELRLYVHFVDTSIMPDYERFSGNGPHLPARIRWDDLAYLFRPGDMVYAPPSSVAKADPEGLATDFAGFLRNAVRGVMGDPGADSASSEASTNATRASHTDQMIWRVYRPPLKGTRDINYIDFSPELDIWKILCYYIDHDGQDYCAVGRTININVFNGERDITQLPCYPIRYMKKVDQVMKAGRLDGQKFIQYINPAQRYAFYRGWTVIRTPSGRGISDKTDRLITSPEHIESEVIVDFEEAFNTNPVWRPEIVTAEEESHQVSIEFDRVKLHQWADEKRMNLVARWEDRRVSNDGVDILQQNAFRKTDPLLNRELNPTVDRLVRGSDDDNLALLPKRLLAYALWERKFIQIDVRDIKAPNFDDKDKAFQNLEIPPKHKTMIESLVYSHFQRRRIETMVDLGNLDIIRGKGKGIVILLFGVPGVGKTATAEAVAQKFEKPLFPITCGDLGFTPESVESSLAEIFRLAHLWDCVLLLDEADVFITARREADLEKNALVSVFLRMLEYYNGILFLTTNRPGVLDEAIKSRVHLNLHYKNLTEPQVLAIFKLNITRLQDIEEKASRTPGYKRLEIEEDDILEFASEHWHQNQDGLGRWNGRQIRNAFLIASSLSHYECDKKNRARVLTKQHFKQVEEMTKHYDEYRYSVLGQTDSVVAFDQRLRDDEFAPTRRMAGGRGPDYPGRHNSGANMYGSMGSGSQTNRWEYSSVDGSRPGMGSSASNHPMRKVNNTSSGTSGAYDERIGRPGQYKGRWGVEPEADGGWDGKGNNEWDS